MILATTEVLRMCGFVWHISINTGYYKCQTSYNEQQCYVEVECNTGYSQRQLGSSSPTPIVETRRLACKKPPQEVRLFIFDEFAASVSCTKESPFE